jgi:hypothetical protein
VDRRPEPRGLPRQGAAVVEGMEMEGVLVEDRLVVFRRGEHRPHLLPREIALPEPEIPLQPVARPAQGAMGIVAQRLRDSRHGLRLRDAEPGDVTADDVDPFDRQPVEVLGVIASDPPFDGGKPRRISGRYEAAVAPGGAPRDALGFEQDDGAPAAREPHGRGQARKTAADDADLRPDPALGFGIGVGRGEGPAVIAIDIGRHGS